MLINNKIQLITNIMQKKQDPKAQVKSSNNQKSNQPDGRNLKNKPQTNNTNKKDAKSTSKDKQKGKPQSGKKNPKERSQSPKENQNDKKISIEKEEPVPEPIVQTQETPKKEIVNSKRSKTKEGPPHMNIKPTFSFNYIYRRELHLIQKLKFDITLEEIQNLISKKIEANKREFVILYKEKEVTNLKEKVYELIKNDKVNYFEVKKKCIILYFIIQ